MSNSKDGFMPRRDQDIPPWLNNFVDRLMAPAPDYKTKYNIADAEVTLLDLGRKGVVWMYTNAYGNRVSSTQYTQFKKDILYGRPGLVGPLTFPTPATFTAVPTTGTPPVPITIMPDVLGLAASIGKRIKNSVNYDPADGAALGLEGTTEYIPSAEETAPNLGKSHLTTGGRVEVDWTKGRFDGVKIEVDRGDGKGWVFLAVDTQPNYVDTVKPAPGTSAKYRYRAIYLLDDEEYGQWSQPFEITVQG